MSISVTPQGKIYLCDTPLELNNKNQLNFASRQAQLTYFNSKIFKTFDNYTYIKKDNVIKVGENIDNIIKCNYLFYRNEGFSNKYYFAFITDMKYINENCTEITFKIDSFQTYQFDISFKTSYVIREHVADDSVGLHTINENLDVGEVVCQETISIMKDTTYYAIIETSYNPFSETDYSAVSYVGGNAHGNLIIAFANETNLSTFLSYMEAKGKIESIRCMYMLPSFFLSDNGYTTQTVTHGGITFTCLLVQNSSNDYSGFKHLFEYTKNYNISGISLRNNKCLCYPFNYLMLSNNVNNQVILKYEDFYVAGEPNKFQLKVESVISVGGSSRLVPVNYKGKALDYDEAIPLGKFPTCSWSGNAFINWLSKNALNITTNILSIIGEVGLSVGTGNLATLNAPIMQGMGLISNFKENSLRPTLQGGNNNGDINFTMNENCYKMYKMHSKTEYLQQIDDYFTKFGYRVNILKVPQFTSRLNWNYLQTQDVNIIGDIPQNNKLEIENMFNDGVTIWHNPATFMDYSQSNSIV